MSEELVHAKATETDRSHAKSLAFTYASVSVSMADASAYARHYASIVADEDTLSLWPFHEDTFPAWRAGPRP